VTRSLQIKGIGPKYKQSLLDWRWDIERRFVFNPNEPVDTRALDQKIAQKTNGPGAVALNGAAAIATGPPALAGTNALDQYAGHLGKTDRSGRCKSEGAEQPLVQDLIESRGHPRPVPGGKFSPEFRGGFFLISPG
jgi:hypothetical protein